MSLRAGWLLLALLPSFALAQVARLEPAELTSTLAGRVCRDVDEDGACSPQEPGLAHVRLVLANGREVRTDAHGLYHFAELEARSPDLTGGLHLRPGRHRVRLDTDSLPPGSRAPVPAATVEVPWGALVLQDFPVLVREPTAATASGLSLRPPVASLAPGGVTLRLSGRATPGSCVVSQGQPAEVDGEGNWSALLTLREGNNPLVHAVYSPNVVQLYRQSVDVVSRGGNWLLIPRPPEPVATLQLPGGEDTPASSGPSTLLLQAPAGTRARSPQGEVVVGPEGQQQVPLWLEPGRNTVPLELELPGPLAWRGEVQVEAAARAFAVGLLDVEGSWAPGGGLQLRGRGAAHAEARLGALSLSGELDLRDTDVRLLRNGSAWEWLQPRAPLRFERAPDPDRIAPEWGDDSVGLAPNPAEGRLRVELRHEQLGRLGLGTYRAQHAEGELGRYHRPLFGPYAELSSALGPVRLGVEAFGGGLADPTRTLAAVPAYEELRTTGGSLYYLGRSPLAEGSELLRVEVRDGLTGLPLAEQHLVRGKDYEIDYLSGRVLLARPLSLLAGAALLRTEPLTAAPEPVLVAQYAALERGPARESAGGEAWADWQWGRLSLSAVQEQREGAPYQLVSAHARTTLGGYTLLAEVARSRGLALAPEAYGLSDDGGLTWLRPGAESGQGGDALGVRLRGPGLGGQGSLDMAFRRRTQGFSDGAHVDTADFRQLSLRAEQPLGPLRLVLLGDDRLAVDPRRPFSDSLLGARTLGVGLGYEGQGWGLRAEVRDASLRASEVAGGGEQVEGGRTSAGVSAHLQVHERVRLEAGHRQALALRGAGLGRVDDSFTSAGVELALGEEARLGVRGGWGPVLGPLAWVHGTVRRGHEVYYGGYSVDVDGPDWGAARAVSGARTELAGGSSLFVEDVASHEANAVRLARAVGFQQVASPALQWGGRYERGVRSLLDVPGALERDTAGLFGQVVLERFRADGRAELRWERGTPERGGAGPVERLQAVVALAAEAVLREDLRLSGRVNLAHTATPERLEARLLEGYTALAWRPGPLLLVARYGFTRELLPGERGQFGDRSQQLLSLQPALRLGDRLSLAAGAHAALNQAGRASAWVLAGSVRPAVRVVGGLEVALEGALRSAAPEGESLYALRAELALRLEERVRLASGYTLLGYTGDGLSPHAQEQGRLYLRAELAY